METIAPNVESSQTDFRGHGGHRLRLETFGAASTPADPWLLFTHGFGQNRLSWRAAAEQLAAQGWQGITMDGRGHGDSDWHPEAQYELDDFCADLKQVAAHRAQKPVLIGASMGGLLGLLAEGEHPGRFAALVLVDVTPRWESAGVARILDFMQAHPEGFVDLMQAQAAIHAYLPHRENKDPERLRGALRVGADGRYRWHWDPRLLSHINQASERYIPRLLAAAAKVQIPTLLLSGSRSDVVSQRTIEEFRSLVPHAEHVEIAEATHLVVGDRNDAFVAAILNFLERLFVNRTIPEQTV